MGPLRLLSWRELSDCCLDGSSQIVVLMWVLRLLSNNLRTPIKTTIWELPSRQQSQSSHHDNNLRPLIKTTIWEFHQDNTLSGPIRTTIWELPSRHKSQSSNQDNHLRAPIKTTIFDGSSKMLVLMGALRLLSWWNLLDCCLDWSSEIVLVLIKTTISELPSRPTS
jgi:hypothetical protein